MTVREIFQFDSGGIIYKDATGLILGTGTAQDSAAPDPESGNGIFIYCQSPARTLYAVADTPITYRVKNSLAITTTPTREQFLTILSENFFFRVTGGGPETQNLDDVLTIGNNAGSNDIDLNGNDITNAYKVFTEFVNNIPLKNLELTSDLDIILNPNGIIDANGKTLNMRNGEIHAAHLIHGRNNTDFKVQAKGTGNLILETNNIERLRITSAGKLIFTFFYTVEMIAALTVDFYAPFDLKISSIINLVNSPTTTILDDGAAYTLGNTILAGSKITVTVNTAAVVNLTTIQV